MTLFIFSAASLVLSALHRTFVGLEFADLKTERGNQTSLDFLRDFKRSLMQGHGRWNYWIILIKCKHWRNKIKITLRFYMFFLITVLLFVCSLLLCATIKVQSFVWFIKYQSNDALFCKNNYNQIYKGLANISFKSMHSGYIFCT